MQTVLIASAVTLAIGLISVIAVWKHPRLRKIMFVLIPVALVLTVLGWLTTLPVAFLGSYAYVSSFAIDKLGIPPLLANAVACLVILPLVFGAYLTLRIQSRFWQRWVGVSLILLTFAGLFFWGYKHEQEVSARKQAEAERIAQKQQIAQAEQARVRQQEHQREIAEAQAAAAKSAENKARAEAEAKRLAFQSALAATEKTRLEIAETQRREQAARLEEARREQERRESERRKAEEERQRREAERRPRKYFASRPVLAASFFQATPVVSESQLREMARAQNVYVKRFAAESEISVAEKLEVRRITVRWETERNPERIYLIHNGVEAPLCGLPPQTPPTCSRSGSQEVAQFDGMSSQGAWQFKIYGNIGWLTSWTLTVQPVVLINGAVARR